MTVPPQVPPGTPVPAGVVAACCRLVVPPNGPKRAGETLAAYMNRAARESSMTCGAPAVVLCSHCSQPVCQACYAQLRAGESLAGIREGEAWCSCVRLAPSASGSA